MIEAIATIIVISTGALTLLAMHLDLASKDTSDNNIELNYNVE